MRDGRMKTIFLQVLEAEDKAAALLRAIQSPEESQCERRFELDVASFAAVPGSPFAYWMSARLRKLFVTLPSFASSERTAVVGLQTSDDARFVRLYWEIPHSGNNAERRWITFAKGGGYSSFYVSIPTVVDWLENGAQSWAFYESNRLRTGGMIKNQDYYFRPGITWLLRAHRFAPQALPAGCIFSLRSYCAFTLSEDLLSTLAIFSSSTFDYLFKTTLGRFNYPEFIVGALLRLPWVLPAAEVRQRLGMLARRASSVRRSLYTRIETSHVFTLPALLQVEGETLSARAVAWTERERRIEADLAAIQLEIDECCFTLYGIDDADRRAMIEGFALGRDELNESTDAALPGMLSDDEQSSQNDNNEMELATELMSWVVGAAFGRFDTTLVQTGGTLASESELFDPLPLYSPAILVGDAGLPLKNVPIGYPVVFPVNGMLVDDRGHGSDLIAAVRTVVDKVFPIRADTWWNELAAMLDPKHHDLRVWLTSSFFGYHLKRYSASHRKAPILWQLAVPSGGYSIWLYAHRLTSDTLFQIQNDVLVPKLVHEERQLTDLTRGAGSNPSARERKEIAEKEALVAELRFFLDEVKRVAPLWNPKLDDGVVLTMAPLWRLVSHKDWQKELKSKWADLVAGKYDWAQAAMHLWPERVVPKCSTDRSFAIAHGLECIFWAEGDGGRWKLRSTPTRPVDELIRERTSIAVKAALKELTEASAPTGAKAKIRRSSL
jgi:hypothetical protein